MSVLIITYDLFNRPDDADRDAIRQYVEDNDGVQLSESTYMVETPLTPMGVRIALQAHVKKGDHFLVFTATRPLDGQHPDPVVRTWISAHLPK